MEHLNLRDCVEQVGQSIGRPVISKDDLNRSQQPIDVSVSTRWNAGSASSSPLYSLTTVEIS